MPASKGPSASPTRSRPTPRTPTISQRSATAPATSYDDYSRVQHGRTADFRWSRHSLRDWSVRKLSGKRQARSEEHTSELQSLMRISYAVFCLKKKKKPITIITRTEKQ